MEVCSDGDGEKEMKYGCGVGDGAWLCLPPGAGEKNQYLSSSSGIDDTEKQRKITMVGKSQNLGPRV